MASVLARQRLLVLSRLPDHEYREELTRKLLKTALEPLQGVRKAGLASGI
jgi:hypothetical protein